MLSFRRFGQGSAPWGRSCVLKVTFKTIQMFTGNACEHVLCSPLYYYFNDCLCRGWNLRAAFPRRAGGSPDGTLFMDPLPAFMWRVPGGRQDGQALGVCRAWASEAARRMCCPRALPRPLGGGAPCPPLRPGLLEPSLPFPSVLGPTCGLCPALVEVVKLPLRARSVCFCA